MFPIIFCTQVLENHATDYHEHLRSDNGLNLIAIVF